MMGKELLANYFHTMELFVFRFLEISLRKGENWIWEKGEVAFGLLLSEIKFSGALVLLYE